MKGIIMDIGNNTITITITRGTITIDPKEDTMIMMSPKPIAIPTTKITSKSIRTITKKTRVSSRTIKTNSRTIKTSRIIKTTIITGRTRTRIIRVDRTRTIRVQTRTTKTRTIRDRIIRTKITIRAKTTFRATRIIRTTKTMGRIRETRDRTITITITRKDTIRMTTISLTTVSKITSSSSSRTIINNNNRPTTRMTRMEALSSPKGVATKEEEEVCTTKLPHMQTKTTNLPGNRRIKRILRSNQLLSPSSSSNNNCSPRPNTRESRMKTTTILARTRAAIIRISDSELAPIII